MRRLHPLLLFLPLCSAFLKFGKFALCDVTQSTAETSLWQTTTPVRCWLSILTLCCCLFFFYNLVCPSFL